MHPCHPADECSLPIAAMQGPQSALKALHRNRFTVPAPWWTGPLKTASRTLRWLLLSVQMLEACQAFLETSSKQLLHKWKVVEREIMVQFKRANDNFVLSHRLGTPVHFKKTDSHVFRMQLIQHLVILFDDV